MSLGVLNNINAVYAENNLNNTSNSLSKVLNQLSSGSKINSGADDAAGLSLVNGLQANSQALAQSQTNASEGVGLLQVADGALSQVTSLLNRAVTLATEASNGTLNTTQDAAANQEYQSILSEINNIGSTTTYNGIQVFGSDKQIYTSDSSTIGASENNLNITSLNTTSGVGNASGTMSYSTGKNVFIDLGAGANQGDALNAAATSTLSVSYANPAGGAALSTTISVGTGTAYANTVNGLMSAINNSGLNLSASFGTAAEAGAGGTGTDTGIIITGSVSSTVAPGANNSVEVTNTAGATAVEDKQVGAAPTLANGTTGTAAISYTASAGIALTGDLSNQSDAQTTLGALNTAISDVAAQDGYIGAQINTLNSVSSVLSTQQENVTSAQNAVQATDYASATSNMSKYEILSQTGISALAQANSMQQEVTKLLQ
jgi:flagellin